MFPAARLVSKLALVLVLVGSLALIRFPTATSLYMNSLIREINKRSLVWYYSRTADAVEGERFVVFHQGGREREARMILKAAEGFYPTLAKNFGLDIAGPIPVLLYEDREALNRSFGWPADANTVGVYWAGSIRVLSPAAWIDPDAEDEVYYRVFVDFGPMVHETAHLFVDYLARGNCPRWFNEGVAQYQEYLFTGFSFGEARRFPLESAYSMAELAEFDALDDQNLAYHQSFSLMAFLVEEYGWPAVLEVIAAFGRGADLESALSQVLDTSPNALDGEWKRWVTQTRE